MLAESKDHAADFVKPFVNIVEKHLVDVLQIKRKIKMRLCFRGGA